MPYLPKRIVSVQLQDFNYGWCDFGKCLPKWRQREKALIRKQPFEKCIGFERRTLLLQAGQSLLYANAYDMIFSESLSKKYYGPSAVIDSGDKSHSNHKITHTTTPRQCFCLIKVMHRLPMPEQHAFGPPRRCSHEKIGRPGQPDITKGCVSHAWTDLRDFSPQLS